MDEALAHARKAVEIAGGGTPILIREADGTVRIAGVVKEAASASSPTGTVSRAPVSADFPFPRRVARMDDQGRIILPTPEEKAEMARAAAAYVAMVAAEPYNEEEARKEEQVLKALGVRGYEHVVLDEDLPTNERA
jgi:hypothetical protein